MMGKSTVRRRMPPPPMRRPHLVSEVSDLFCCSSTACTSYSCSAGTRDVATLPFNNVLESNISATMGRGAIAYVLVHIYYITRCKGLVPMLFTAISIPAANFGQWLFASYL
jgi:hypothetical protein